MGDFNLPDNVTAEQVDASHGEPDRDRVCGTCKHCIEECCDYGMCDVKLKSQPQDFDSWLGVVDYIEDARVDMQVDSCAYWKEY